MPEVKSESRRERYRRWFRMFDANGDKYIDEKDFVLMSERLVRATRVGGQASASGLIEAARNRFAQIVKADTDGDGRVTEDEYLQATLSQQASSPEIDAVHDAFARSGFASFDMDGDGVLGLNDYVLTHVAFGLNPRLQEVVDRFQHWDTNGDGVITRDEYVANYHRDQRTDEHMPFFFCAD